MKIYTLFAWDLWQRFAVRRILPLRRKKRPVQPRSVWEWWIFYAALRLLLPLATLGVLPAGARSAALHFTDPDSLSNLYTAESVAAQLGDGAILFGPAGMVAPSLCNDPLTGKNVVIDAIQGGTACLLCNNADVDNLIDGDLSNFTSFNPTAILLATPVVSIKDIALDYDPGTRAGFVIQPLGGLLGSGLLGSFQIRTYLNNVLQETVTSGSNLQLRVLGASDGKQRISFVSTLAFDEIELVQTAAINAFSSLRVYYAFVEPLGCDYNCATKVITGSAFTPAVVGARTGLIGGACVLCGVNNSGRAVDADTSNYANVFVTVGIGASVGLSVKASTGIPIPAGYDAGFVVRDDGLLGILSASVLGGMSIRTYSNNIPQETVPFNSVADLTLLGGNLQSISFKTTLPFDEIQLIINSGLVGAALNVRAYYAFVRPDSDNDGFVNCVDKCAGQNDNLDADGDGIPDGCDDPVCTGVNGGVDLVSCPTAGNTAQLPAAGPGQSWTPVSGNPSPATVSSAGAVAGMLDEGIYGFVLSEGLCLDTVFINHQQSNLDAACNNPITGYGVIIDQVGLTGGICILCGGGGAAIDGDLNNFSTYTIGVGVLTATSIISVKDTTQVYPAGRRTGFVVSAAGGLLDATALGSLQIRTYQNNVLRETATVGSGLLGASALSGNGNRQRLSFVTTLSFDEVELVAISAVGALTTLRVYYAFEEPGAGCPDLSDGSVCGSFLTADDATFCGQIAYDRTGITGLACVACSVDQIGNLIDANPANATTINLTVGVGAAGQVSVKTRQEIPGGYIAGFRISGGANLLDANVLAGITLRTYLNGVQRDELIANSGLLNLIVLDNTTGVSQISFVTTQSFDEVQLIIDGVLNALATTQVYGAFVYGDSDGDATPDCIDKCCGAPDFLDSNGNGQPNACESFPLAVNDMFTVNEDQSSNLNVLANDSFGADGPGTAAISIVDAPNHGTATVNNGGTPNNPLDDLISYTASANYTGADTLQYSICDVAGDCDTATVFIGVAPVNDAPVANPDPYTVNEDMPLSGNVTSNDSDVDGPMVVVSTVTPPGNGMLMLNPDGTFTYTPNLNYSGTDTFSYSLCDGGTPALCDSALVTITIAPTSLYLSVKMQLQGALLGSPDAWMRDNLRAPVQYIPNQEPYSALASYTHSNGGGGETVAQPATVFADHAENSIVDWVFIELRSSATSIVATRSALLQRDGDVVETDGVSPVYFSNSSPGSYFVAVRHRNHLGAMTATSVALSHAGNTVDFTSLSTPLWDDGSNFDGLEQTTIQMKYALWAANTNVDVAVVFAGQSNDKDRIFNQTDQAPGNILRSQTYILQGYYTGDDNLNARAVFAGQNNDVDLIFNNVDTHPRNVLRSQTFIIPQQLPQQ